MAVYRIEASPTAEHLMSQIPGLRHRVEEVLGGVLETAVQFARLHGQQIMGSPADPMRLHVGNYVIWYFLDATNAAARVVYIEMASREDQAQRAGPLSSTPRQGDDAEDAESVA